MTGDWRRAVSCLESRPEVDAGRIGLWGTSYAGGHAMVLGATDRRLRAVVSQVPTISGHEQGLRRVDPDARAGIEKSFDEDERARFRGEAPRTVAVVSDDPPSRSVRHAPPGCTTPARGSPASAPHRLEDTVTVTDPALAAYERALEPKRLQLLPGGHFDPYTAHFGQSSAAALAWFREHLA
ncbi:alpha/beta hydrolase [Streptomyces sp. NPDC052023]|uniref:alpha/beta hydrolase n=1 Tax=Streptomyces sp. NPDC052023 TaxID=3365681 RepID=UPI0037D1F2FC